MKFKMLLSALATLSLGSTAGANGPGGALPGSYEELAMSLIQGGWSFRSLDGATKDKPVPIVHRKGPGSNSSLKIEYSFCALSQSDLGGGSARIMWQGDGNLVGKISVGSCEHIEGFSTRTMVAYPEGASLVLFFKRVGEASY